MRKLLLTFIAGLFYALPLFAQDRTVTGKVTDERDGSPISGVSVLVSGSSLGTITLADGTFSIKVPAGTKTLVFSSVDHVSKDVNVANKDQVTVGLTTQDRAMTEIVVVGYGVQRKRAVTGAIGKINATPIADLITPSIDRQLAGRTAGIQVTAGTGLVNVAPRIRIRGVNSINGARGPLVVLDGMPILDGSFSTVASTNALADINPADVESVEVLKDGSATAIYGSRAANGVLLITTKKGRTGRSNVNYSAVFGFSNPYNRFDMLNAEEFVTVANEKFASAGIAPQAFLNSEKTNTDWQNFVFRQNAKSQIHNLSVEGGSDRTNYYFSINYANQEGLVITNDVKRYALRANISHKVNNWLTISNNISLSRTQDNDQNNVGNAVSGAIAAALRSLPNVRVYNPDQPQYSGFNLMPDGSALGRDANLRAIENDYSNIGFVLTQNRWTSTKQRILNNFSLDVKPWSFLTLTSKIGIDYQNGVDFQAFDPRHGDGRGSSGYVFNQSLNNFRWAWQNYANLSKTFDDHSINATVGSEVARETFNAFNAAGQVVADRFFLQRNVITGSYQTQLSGGSYNEGPGFVSYFARVGYDYQNKYFIQGSLRRDGLSRFTPDFRFGMFPGGSAGWRISEENFWRNGALGKVMNEFKIRGSWARVGNDQIAGGLFPYLSQYGNAQYGGQSGIAISVVGNNGLSWETNNKLNVGADISFFKNRMNFTVDWFSNKNNGLVLAAPLPVSFGVPGNSIFRNIGNMVNKGIELTLSGAIIKQKDFTWEASVNFTQVNNEVLALYLDQDVISNYNILRVGEPVNALFGYKWAGVNSGNGNPMYYKADGTLIQGNIANTSYFGATAGSANLGSSTTLAASDRAVLANVLPTYYGGFSNTLRYKGFSFDMLWRFSGGNKIFNLTRQEALLTQAFQNNGREILSRWQKPGDVSNVPRLWQGRDNFTNLQQNAVSRFVETGNFVRLENIQLAYNVNLKTAGFNSKLGLRSLRIFVQGQNMLLITKYTGIDPENITEQGIDNNTIPRPVIISFGFNVGL